MNHPQSNHIIGANLATISSAQPHIIRMNTSFIVGEFALSSNFDYSLSHMIPIKCEHFVLRRFLLQRCRGLKVGQGDVRKE